MATHKFYVTVICFCIFFSTVFSTCKKGGLGCANAVYSFKDSATAFPDIDSIYVGDTLFISSNIPTNQTDLSSGQIVDYSNASNLSLSIQFLKLVGGSVSDPGTIYVANKFSCIPVIGAQITDPFTEGERSFSFKERTDMYNLKVAMIPQDTGAYLIAISNGVNVTRSSGKCTKANYEIDFANIDQHLYLYQNNRPGYIINNYEKTHVYCFKVK